MTIARRVLAWCVPFPSIGTKPHPPRPAFQTPGNLALFAPYDLIALHPTTTATLSLACLTHSAPSNLTAHIISIPLTLPRLPFRLKHTLVRTALRNGALFEIAYAGALGDAGSSSASASTSTGGGGGGGERRNWWAAAGEVVRVTKGKGVLVSSGASGVASMRAPRDVGNLYVAPQPSESRRSC